MNGRFSFVLFVGGHEYCAVYDQHIKSFEQYHAMKFGIWAGAQMFRKTASVYVYERKDNGDWKVTDSINTRNGDDFTHYMSDGYMKQLAR